MTEIKTEHLEIISRNKVWTYELNKMQEKIEDVKESISFLTNAIKCGFLLDKHSLILQKWIVEYKLLYQEFDTHLTEMSTRWMKDK
jgi:ribosome-associated toxin RatA of RatAB toxin-antitoxin module